MIHKQIIRNLIIPVLVFTLFMSNRTLGQNLNIVSTSGSINSINASTTESIVFRSGYMKVKTTNCQSEYYNLNYTSEINFDENVGTAEAISIKEFTIYPNPSAEILNIQVNEINIGSTLFIYSIHGKMVKTTTINENDTQIVIKELPTGIYLISINNQITKFTKL